jgi:SAM-dependent methyltransferase
MGEAPRFGRVASDYERGRAGWPRAALKAFEGRLALDVGAGTGKLTQLLLDRFETVVAIEPSREMRELGQNVVPEASWLEASAETLPLGDGEVDAVFVAEAFHWFEADRATQEIARVLRPGGALVAVFKTWASPEALSPFAEAESVVGAVLREVGPTGRGKVVSGEWRKPFATASFTPFEYQEFRHEETADREAIVSFYLSLSPIASLPVDERELLRKKLTSLIKPGFYPLDLLTERWVAYRTDSTLSPRNRPL